MCQHQNRAARGVGQAFSLSGLDSAMPKSKPHRLKSLCKNRISRGPAAKAELIRQDLRHG